MPKVGEGGKFSGNYTLEGIIKLDLPYRCTFQKEDATSKIVGIIHIYEQKVYGEFRIRTDLVENEFNSFLLIKNGEAYAWTSLGPVGYKSPAAKSAIRGASVQEQAQIIGTRDKVQYDCQPWQGADNTIFETPSFIQFTEL